MIKIDKKEILKELICYRPNGLYLIPFFTKHEIEQFDDSLLEDNDFELLIKQYFIDNNYEFNDENKDYQENWDDAFNEIMYKLDFGHIYYEPAIFDEEIAVKCDLVPFLYKNKKLLAWFSNNMFEGYKKLDAYQFLTSKTIDVRSYLLD